MYDFIVVGAGPSGSYASFLLGKMGYRVLQLEEDRSVGKPVECTGIVSKRVTSMVSTDNVVNTVHGAHIYFPSGKEIHVKKKEETIIIERDRFDQDVSAKAIGSGVQLSVNSSFISAEVKEGHILVKYRKDRNLMEEKALALIGADGAGSLVRRTLYRDQNLRRVVSAYQVEAAKRMEDQDSVDVYLGSEYSRGFFGWAAPAGDLSRIGSAGFGLGREKFINIYKRFMDPSKVSITGGLIPIAPLQRTYSERSLLVGDAAGLAKPLTGGGIYTGMLSGELAAYALNSAYEQEDFSAGTLRKYQVMWKREIGGELNKALKVQKRFSAITNTSFNAMGEMLSDPGIREKINNIGDIDYPTRVVGSILLRKPGLVKHVFFPVKERG